VAARLALDIDRNPVGMRGLQIVIGGVRIGSHEHRHALFATAGDEFAKHVAVAKPCAAVMKGNRGRIIRDTATAAQTDPLGACALEGFEPEGKIEVGRVVFNKRELKPAHGLRCPGGNWLGFGGQTGFTPQAAWRDLDECNTGAGGGCGLQELPASKRERLHARNGTGAAGQRANEFPRSFLS